YDRFVSPSPGCRHRGLIEDAGRLGIDHAHVADRTVGADRELEVDPSGRTALERERGVLRLHGPNPFDRVRIDDLARALCGLLSGGQLALESRDCGGLRTRLPGLAQPALRPGEILPRSRVARRLEQARVEGLTRLLRRGMFRVGLRELRQIEL